MAVLNNSNAISPTGYNLTNSLRFRGSASPYLSRTFGTPTGTTKGTWSGWVKRGSISSSAVQYVWSAANYEWLAFLTTDKIQIATPGNSGYWETTQVFRDPSAWYHIVVAFDTTLATATDRCKLWINGVQVTTWSAQPTITLNSTFQRWNVNAYTGAIGCFDFNKTAFFDGYIDEINWIDGQALTQSSFGSTNATTGVWQPAKYTGTYGNNGFYLNFSDIALTSGSNAGLGKDFSGNTNYWNTNNISVTTGTTYDAMTDVPTLTSLTVSNYAVLNPLYNTGALAFLLLSNGNLTATENSGSAAWRTRWSTIGMTSGKWYSEFTLSYSGTTSILNGTVALGLYDGGTATYVGQTATTYGYFSNAFKINNASSVAYGATYANGDIIGIAFDADAGTLTFYKNGVTQGTAYTSIPSGLYYFACSAYWNSPDGTSTWNANFGQRPFSYTPPTGFVRLNTYNLPDSTIKKGNSYMDATLYTGTGATLSVTNASAFKPDFVWVKGRSGATDHALYDSVRGTTNDLVSNSTAAATTQAQGLTAFGTNGFTVGTLAKMNTNAATYVGWQWQAGQGSTSSNTSGSITSTVSVNTTAGFSVVTYTGVGGAGTIGHGLGVAPKFIITKYRNIANGWYCYHTSAGTGNVIILNSTAATVADAAFNSTAPTSSVFSVGSINTNQSTGTYVAYCWAEIAGFSKFGSYTGNGSADGPFVYLGFRPSWILIKSSSAASTNWWVLDDARNTYNLANLNLIPNDPSVELNNSTYFQADFLSNGFKLRSTGQSNTSAATYIYAAFAENPFKNANAR